MLISVHIPKTAGSTFGQVLGTAFQGKVFFDYGKQYEITDGCKPGPGIRLRRRFERLRYRSQRPDDQCIHGHFEASKYRREYPDAKLVTWVRDPVERVVSHYCYWRRNPRLPHSLCRRMNRENWSLEAFAEVAPMRNLMNRYINGIDLEEFTFIGIQEQFAPCLRQFYALFDLKPVQPAPVLLANRDQSKVTSELAPELKNHIRELNESDCILYDAARRHAVSNSTADPLISIES